MSGTQEERKGFLLPFALAIGYISYYERWFLLCILPTLFHQGFSLHKTMLLLGIMILGYSRIYYYEKHYEKIHNKNILRYVKGEIFSQNNSYITLKSVEIDNVQWGNLRLKIPKNIKSNVEIGNYLHAITILSFDKNNVIKGRVVEITNIDKQNPSFVSFIRRKITNFFLSKNDHLGALWATLTTGDKSYIDKDTRKNFNQAGLSHILAISGLHIGIIAFSTFNFLRIFFCLTRSCFLIPFERVKQLSACITIVISYIYFLIAGASYSALRSFIMTLIYFTSVIKNRSVQNWQNVSLSSSIILLLYPESLFNIGYQLSLLNIIYLIIINEEIKKHDLHILRRNIIISATLSLGTLFHTCFYFQYYTLNGVITNIIALPLIQLIMPLMILYTIIPVFFLYYPLSVLSEIFLFTNKISLNSLCCYNIVYFPYLYKIVFYIALTILIFHSKRILAIPFFALSLLPIIQQPKIYGIFDKNNFYILDIRTQNAYTNQEKLSYYTYNKSRNLFVKNKVYRQNIGDLRWSVENNEWTIQKHRQTLYEFSTNEKITFMVWKNHITLHK